MLSSFFSKTFAFNLSGLSVTLIGVIGLIILGGIVYLIFWLYRRIKDLETPKYGFGGKPLYALLLVLSLIAFLPIAVYVSQKSAEIRMRAEERYKLVIEYYIVEELEGDEVVVAFSAVPYYDDEVWGGKVYDFDWLIKDGQEVEFNEKGKSVDEPSYFTVQLKRGRYTVEVKARSEEGVEFGERREIEV